MTRSLAACLVCLLAVTAADAADVRVTYLVDAKTLKASAPAGTSLTFALHATSACNAPVATQNIDVEDVTLLATVKAAGVKSGPKPPKAIIEMRHTMTGVTPQPAFYLKVTGPGVSPVGGACQLQYASVGSTAAGTSLTSCPPDAVLTSSGCADKYESSLWDIPPAETVVIQKVKDGTVTLADLTGAGAVQLGCDFPPFNATLPPPSFPLDGEYTAPLYAASVPGVYPTTCISMPQAIAACTLSDKHLLTNSEWLAAAAGTPSYKADDGSTSCNTVYLYDALPVASRSACVSTAGAWDMVGNAWEWTLGEGGLSWMRGGAWGDDITAGVLTGVTISYPNAQLSYIGFRCGR